MRLTVIESVLELTQWKASFVDLMRIFDRCVAIGMSNILAHCTFSRQKLGLCKQIVRITHSFTNC